jgi:L-aminopeptidase/D-esterase-like protein
VQEPSLPAGVHVGHWTDPAGLTGCTVVLAPEATVGSGDLSGGAPATRETDLLSPGARAPAVQAVMLTGGSAFGLSAADGVVRWLEEHGAGTLTPTGPVPLVPSASVYDLPLGDPTARPGPDAGYAACQAAGVALERGNVGAGTGCTVGKLLGPDHWTKGGLGAASERVGEATVTAIAAVNAFGDVIGADGQVVAGPWRDGVYERTADLLRAGHEPLVIARESTTLVCVVTDARLTKTGAWLIARASGAGVARAVDPSATTVDGDYVFCLATGRAEAEPISLSSAGAAVTAAAIRNAVIEARGVPGCEAARDRPGRPS